ncbi:hypothetical protein [uncultured Cellulomonas sp.]|uniref:hypothetical protein n=1 Tax=uncultured Cellulomonas sp. TaxID=189682 RepID=UPI0028EA1AC4|nr:hypothetical protein [uncultured Cellulomonas sp.]
MRLGTASRASHGDDDGLADAEDGLTAMGELGTRHFAFTIDLRAAMPTDKREDGLKGHGVTIFTVTGLESPFIDELLESA